MSVYVNGREVFNNSDINNPDIDGGTIDSTVIGNVTPASGAFTTIKQTTGAADGAMPISDASGNLVLTASTGSGAPVRATNNTQTILKQLWTAATELTIASGIITVTQSLHLVDTESDAVTDTVETINGGTDGQMLAIRAAHTDRTVVIAETGNIYCGGSSISLDDTKKYVLFIYDGALTKWVVVGGTASVPGSDTQVIFNDGGALGADAGMTYVKATDTLTTNIALPDAGKFTLDIAPASDHTATGKQFAGVAGEALTYGQTCYLKSDGKYWKTDSDASSTMPVVAMALASINAEATGNFLEKGWARDDSWSWTVGGTLYADNTTAGGMTQTAPSGEGDQIQIVGYAETATVIKFAPSPIVTEIALDANAETGTSRTITVANLTAVPIVYYGDNAADQTYTLTAFSTADIGKKFTIIKTGTGAGKAIIQLPASSYAYASGQASSEAGTVYLAASARGSMTWMITSATTMQLVDCDGSLTFA